VTFCSLVSGTNVSEGPAAGPRKEAARPFKTLLPCTKLHDFTSTKTLMLMSGISRSSENKGCFKTLAPKLSESDCVTEYVWFGCAYARLHALCCNFGSFVFLLQYLYKYAMFVLAAFLDGGSGNKICRFVDKGHPMPCLWRYSSCPFATWHKKVGGQHHASTALPRERDPVPTVQEVR
jgi:hypothetical protein